MGDDIRNYHFNFRDRYLIRIPSGWTNKNKGEGVQAWVWFENNYPALAEHLFQYKAALENRLDKVDYWWELRACDYYDDVEKPKIIYPIISREPRFCFDDSGIYTNDKTYIIPGKDLYLLGLLNSKLIWQYPKRVCSVLGDPDKGGRLELRYDFMKTLPIRRIDFENVAEKLAHDEIVRLVERMLALQKERQSVGREEDLDRVRNLEKQIAQIDAEIDQRVYALYGLTPDEIKVVEAK